MSRLLHYFFLTHQFQFSYDAPPNATKTRDLATTFFFVVCTVAAVLGRFGHSFPDGGAGGGSGSGSGSGSSSSSSSNSSSSSSSSSSHGGGACTLTCAGFSAA
jgi:hypothetical protein